MAKNKIRDMQNMTDKGDVKLVFYILFLVLGKIAQNEQNTITPFLSSFNDYIFKGFLWLKPEETYIYLVLCDLLFFTALLISTCEYEVFKCNILHKCIAQKNKL
ncbi:MAG: hypothetical protein IJ262_06585 [Clostridia bacterium]|nr:hypothetical protein [Clostridia bacterium]